MSHEVEVEKLHNKIADMNGECARLSTELVEIQRIQAETASALARKAEELDEVTAEREIVTRQRRALTEKHAETLSALAGLREEHAEAVSALGGLREEHAEAVSALAGLREEHAEAVSALGGLREEHAEALSALAGLREEHAGAVSALGGLREEHAEALSALAGLREEHAEALSALAGLREALGQMQAEFKQATQELQEKTSLLGQIQRSHGWRALSFYYRLRARLFPGRTLRTVREGVALLRDARLVSASGLLDREWYLRQNPDVAEAHVNPLRHYLRQGAFEERDPNPWFDSDWYLQQYQDVAKTGANPLVHYLRHGAIEGRDPNPWFDSDWYLQQYQDVAKTGLNPLVHYLRHGAVEGRDPNPWFDSDWYLEQYPDVVKAGVNPLTHYVLFGAREGRSPKPDFDRDRYVLQPAGAVHTDEPCPTDARVVEGPTFHTRPIACPVQPERLRGGTDERRLICVTHVLPYPSRAGNEYRIHRMLDWLAASGFEVFLVVCPLPGCVVTPERLIRACSVYSNLILCERDGTLLYHLADGDGPIKGLDRVRPRYFGKLLGEEHDTPPISPRLLPIVRTFCPDLLAEVLSHLDSVLQPEIILAEYVFMTRALPLVRREAIKVVDTHDVFSTKHDKIVQFGIEDNLALNADEEASLLAYADLVIAIQSEEAAELDRLVPNKPIVTVGIDFDPINTAGASVADPIVLVVGSDNALNVRGLRDFLRFAWPLVRREVPNVELRVIGAVGLQVDVDDPSVKILGLVDDLTAAYAGARVVINPAVAGTGLKIKTIEALCHLRPLVTWPSGVDGLESDVRALCYLATDWYMFARRVIDLCKSEDASQVLISKRNEILQRFSPDTIYGALKAALSSMHAGAS